MGQEHVPEGEPIGVLVKKNKGTQRLSTPNVVRPRTTS